MTNEELIARARRQVEIDDLERNRYGKSMAPAQSHAHFLLVKLADALEAATVEPEWEYLWGETGDCFEGFDPYATYEEARADFEENSDYQSHSVMRRRKAGAWEPVGGDDA